jgi:hypothetical protein
MAEQEYYRIIQKRNKQFVVDLQGNTVSPQEAIKLGQGLVTTAEQKAYVYLGTRESDDLIKIGRTTRLNARPSEVGAKFIHTIECDFYGDQSNVQIEHFLHDYYKEDRVEGEWFKLAPFDVFLIQQNIKFGKEAAPFFKAFDEAFERVAEILRTEGFIVMIAKYIEPCLHDEMDRTAVWYIANCLPLWRREAGDEIGAAQVDAINSLLVAIGSIRAARKGVNQSKTDFHR